MLLSPPPSCMSPATLVFVFFFNDTATTEIYTLSLHDAFPIWSVVLGPLRGPCAVASPAAAGQGDRKSTRLNSSHGYISYAVFCLKKKKKPNAIERRYNAYDITPTSVCVRSHLRTAARVCLVLSDTHRHADLLFCVFFFFNDTATTEIYTLSLHDALPIYLSLGIPRGKVTAIMGGSGCGKTSLLNLIGGRLRPGRGQVLVDGQNVPDLNIRELYQLRKRMGMLFQPGALLTDLSV